MASRSIVEVDLGERRHRHHQLEQLALQAAEVLVTGLRWAGLDPSSGMVDLIRAGGEHRELNLATRPPISSIVGSGLLPGGR